jgi:hypothetical protein
LISIEKYQASMISSTAYSARFLWEENIMQMRRTVKNGVIWLIFILLMVTPLLVFGPAARAVDEFSLRITANNVDISEAPTIEIDLEKDLVVNLEIYDVTRELTLKTLSMTVTLGGIEILTRNENLGNYYIEQGGVFRRDLIINTSEAMRVGDRPLATGIYPSEFRLAYTVNDQEMVWSQWKNLKILGNPLNTPAGMAGLLVGLGTLIAFLSLARSMAAQKIRAGAVLASNVSVKALSRLKDLASDRLEPTARGRVVGNIVGVGKKRIVKDKCPICDTRLKHGHCFTCKKSAKEVREEYRQQLKDLCLQGGQLLADDQISTMDELCKALDISGKLGTDVIATLEHAKLVKVKGIARQLTGRAVTAGIGTGLSTIIWVTVGGFAVLGTSALIAILAVSIVVPFTLTKSLQYRAKRSIRRSVA